MGLGLMVQGSGIRIIGGWSLRFRVEGSGFGFGVWGLRCGV